MADVFISYARADEAVARRVAKALQGAGLDVWWDADLPAHRAYSEVIERELAEARAVVVLWSKTSAASQWVRAEADFARNKGNLVQAQIDGTQAPMPFNQIQCADLSGWRGSAKHAGWSKVEASIKALVPGHTQSAAAPARRFAASGRLPPYGWIMAAVLALIAAASVYVYAFGSPRPDRKPVLAVLPFRNLDPQDASLVSGIWEDTRAAIGRNPQLIVLGPNSAEQLAAKGEGAARKAADYLLQASVRRSNDRIRVTANLVRSKSGEQLWTQDFDRKLDDIFAVQSEIAREIEGRIRGRLAAEGGTIPEHIATSGEVYALYSDARAKIRNRGGPEERTVARSELEQVVTMDPNFAPGWAALALADYNIPPSGASWRFNDPPEVYARKAIDLAPNLAEAHSAMAYALGLKGPVARAEIERAVQLDPNNYDALLWLGNIRSNSGDKAGALQAWRRAADIEPFFWPAVFNLYGALREAGERDAMQELIDQERRVGAAYFAVALKIDDLLNHGRFGEAANVGLTYWASGRTEGRSGVAMGLWTALLQLGFTHEASKLGPAPDFAEYLWRLDPKGLDIMEAHGIDPKSFFEIGPLAENASRSYLLSGRSRTLADMYLSLGVSADGFSRLLTEEESQPMHFVLTAPLVAVALEKNGHPAEAKALLQLAQVKATANLKNDDSATLVALARIYALQGHSAHAIGLLDRAVAAGWLGSAPELLPDLASDPALASLNGDPRFERLRSQILAAIARERAKVDQRLLRQLNAA